MLSRLGGRMGVHFRQTDAIGWQRRKCPAYGKHCLVALAKQLYRKHAGTHSDRIRRLRALLDFALRSLPVVRICQQPTGARASGTPTLRCRLGVLQRSFG